MAYEAWRICDICGKRVGVDDKEGRKPWMDVHIHDEAYWGDEDPPELDIDVCSRACAIKGIKAWLHEQEQPQ